MEQINKLFKHTNGKYKGLMPLVLIVLLLPLLLGAVYLVNTYVIKAQTGSQAFNIDVKRISTVAATVCFDTKGTVKASMQCSIGIDGAKFFCGEDTKPETKHCIKTADAGVLLNPNTGYYGFLDTGMPEKTKLFIPSKADDAAFGLSMDSYNDEVMGLCSEDKGFDPALDTNQDGCINTSDILPLLQ